MHRITRVLSLKVFRRIICRHTETGANRCALGLHHTASGLRRSVCSLKNQNTIASVSHAITQYQQLGAFQWLFWFAAHVQWCVCVCALHCRSNSNAQKRAASFLLRSYNELCCVSTLHVPPCILLFVLLLKWVSREAALFALRAFCWCARYCECMWLWVSSVLLNGSLYCVVLDTNGTLKTFRSKVNSCRCLSCTEQTNCLNKTSWFVLFFVC